MPSATEPDRANVLTLWLTRRNLAGALSFPPISETISMKTRSRTLPVQTSRSASHDLPVKQPTQRVLDYGAIAARAARAARAALTLTLFLAACSRDARPADSTSAMTSRTTGDSATASDMPMAGMGGMQGKEGMGGMGSMSGMSGMSGMTGMMTAMNTHMQSMMTASGAQMKGMVPAHRQMAANMLSEMNAEMKTMKMSGDSAWNALADSVRRDLIQLPEMSAGDLKNVMPAHRARMTRLMQMHQTMSKDMKM